MYIIVALSVVLTSMMFASTTTVVYLIASSKDSSGGGPEPEANRGSQDVVTTVAGVTTRPGVHTGGSISTVASSVPPTSSQTQSSKPSSAQWPVTYFTRWGSTRCTANSELLYTGYTAGSRYNYHGGTSSVLCLPKDPQFKSFYAGASGTYLYGSEYNARNTDLKAVFGKELNEQDVPCAVCESTGSSTMMIAARTECYNNWTKQYSGYLMTSHLAHNKSMDIVCIDENPEVVPGQGANSNGALFYFVEANGQLPYSRGKELTCVVCTK